MTCCLRAVLILVLFALGFGCAQKEQANSNGMSLFASIPPQATILQMLAGEQAQVSTLVQPGQSPVTYDPTPRQTASIAESRACFLIGVPFEERFVARSQAILTNVTVIDCQSGLMLRRMASHSHDDQTEHDESGLDPHVWMSPRLMKQVAGNMAEALSLIDPKGKTTYESNLMLVENRLDSLDQELSVLLAPYAGDTIYVFHPSYGYFTEHYGLTQVALEPEGKEADARYLSKLFKQLKSSGVGCIFVQPQFSDHLALSAANELGVRLVTLDPLNADYFENMLAIARDISHELGTKPGAKQGTP